MNAIKQVTIEDIVYAHANGRGECSDSLVLRRFYEPLCQHRLTPDALLFYGMLIDPDKGETKYLLAFAAALERAKGSVDDLDEKLRLRSGMSAQDLLQHAKTVNIRLRSLQQQIAEGLKKALPLPTDLPGQIAEKLRKLSAIPMCV